MQEGSAVRAEILKINSETPESSLVKYAADQIRAGEVLGMPTDTFYGLAADPFNLRAVDRVYDIKTRSRHKPLSLLIESVDQAEELAKVAAGGVLRAGAEILAGTADHHRESGIAPAAEGDRQYRQRGAARAECEDSAGGGDGGGDSDHGHVGQSERCVGVHQRRAGARPARRAASASSWTAELRRAISLPPSLT